MSGTTRRVFIAGATGYMGTRLGEELIRRGHVVSGLVRAESKGKLPARCAAVIGNALDGASFRDKLAGADTFVQLVGVTHPSPAKGREFRQVDLRSCEESVAVAVAKHVGGFVFVSGADPAPA